MQLHRLKAGPAAPHTMIEVSILLSVINLMGRNVATIFCHEIIKKFLAEQWRSQPKSLGGPKIGELKYLI